MLERFKRWCRYNDCSHYLFVFLGIVLIISGLGFAASGVYCAIVYMFIGGIVDIINQIKAPEVDAVIFAYAIAKILLANLTGGLSLVLGFSLVGIGSMACIAGNPFSNKPR